MKEKFSENIKHLVNESDLNAVEISKEVGVHNAMIYHYMNGVHEPTISVFKKLCRVLRCRYEDILGDVNED